MEKFVKIGIVPIKRGFTDMVSALEQKNLFLNKCRQIAPDAVALCDLEGVLPEGILYDAISETVQCLPDAIQLLTPCTVGNGWLRVYHFGIYALTLYNKQTGEGTRVRLNVEALQDFPHVRAWFFKEKPKREQEPALLQAEIKSAGMDLLQAAPIQIHPDFLVRKGKGVVGRCPSCGEWYPTVLGKTCRICQGDGPYTCHK